MGLIGSILVKLGMQTAEFDAKCNKTAKQTDTLKGTVEKLNKTVSTMRMAQVFEGVSKVGEYAVKNMGKLAGLGSGDTLTQLQGVQAVYEGLAKIPRIGWLGQLGGDAVLVADEMKNGASAVDAMTNAVDGLTKKLTTLAQAMPALTALKDNLNLQAASIRRLMGKEGYEQQTETATIELEKTIADANKTYDKLKESLGTLPQGTNDGAVAVREQLRKAEQEKNAIIEAAKNKFAATVQATDYAKAKANYDLEQAAYEKSMEWGTSIVGAREKEMDALEKQAEKQGILTEARKKDYWEVMRGNAKALDDADKLAKEQQENAKEQLSVFDQLKSQAESMLSIEDQTAQKRQEWKDKLGANYDTYAGLIDKITKPQPEHTAGESVDMASRWRDIQSDLLKPKEQITKADFDGLMTVIKNLEVRIKG